MQKKTKIFFCLAKVDITRFVSRKIYTVSCFMLIILASVSVFYTPIKDSLTNTVEKLAKSSEPYINKAKASYQFPPSSSSLIVGTEAAINSGSGTSPVNTGSWKGTLAPDAFSWVVNTDATNGLNQQIGISGVTLNNANKMIVNITAGSGSVSLSRLYEICDWTSSASVNSAADAQCTTGGWRTLNKTGNITRNAITATANTGYTFHVYNGFWSVSGSDNTLVSTPISNFINSSDGNKVLIRAYSTTAIATTHNLDWVSVDTVIDPVYSPASFTQTSGGTPSGSYIRTIQPVNTLIGGNDTILMQVPGTASSIVDFYYSFKDVRSYTGMNTIYFRTDTYCTASGINYNFKIYNFTSSLWETLNSVPIPCTVSSDQYNLFAKNNVNTADYISSGEIRIGWYGSANSTTSLVVDFAYVVVGSTNSDSAQCEISFGTGTATDCTKSRDLDTTLVTPNTWQPSSELESATFNRPYYPNDNDSDGTTGESAVSVNVNTSITLPSNAIVGAVSTVTRIRSNSTLFNVLPQLKDFSGLMASVGSWINNGQGSVSGTYTPSDPVIIAAGSYLQTSPDNFIDSERNIANIRIRTFASTTAATISPNIDFLMFTLRWAEDTEARPSPSHDFIPTASALLTGTESSITAAAASGNTGSWKGVLANDAYNWNVNTNASTGLNQQLIIGEVNNNNANKMIVTLNANAGSVTLNRFYQICDWASNVGVDNPSDTECTGGGWRTLNKSNGSTRAAIAEVTQRTYTFHIYDGYWTTSLTGNTSVSTPLSHFIGAGNKNVLIRAYSGSAVSTTHFFNFASVATVIDPIYYPAGFTQISGGTITTGFASTQNPPILISGTNTTGSDNIRLDIPGTAGAISSSYLSYKNIRTYSGVNTIVVDSEYGCSSTGINITPTIYNFNSSSWENLASPIACSITDATNRFAKNNVTITDYVSNGEIRIGWMGSANSITSIRIDTQYITLGSTNADSSKCEISFGTGTVTDCTKTRDMDTTLVSPNTWQPTTELESTTFGHAYYSSDNDGDGVTGESAVSINSTFSMVLPANANPVGISYIMRFRSNNVSLRMIPQLRDSSGANPTISGGWNDIGASNQTTTYTYTDGILNGYFLTNIEDYLNTTSDSVNVRMRSTTSTITTAQQVDVDFMMTSLRWVEVEPEPTYSQSAYRIFNNLDSTDVNTPLEATNTSGVLSTSGSDFRLRMLVNVDSNTVDLNYSTFKLQFAGKGSGTCNSPSGGSPSTYIDVTNSTIIAFKNNATPSDNTALIPNVNDPVNGSNTIKNQTYEESNNFINSQSAIYAGQDGKWDFSLFDNDAPGLTSFCFRIVKSTGTLLSSYSNFPQIKTSASPSGVLTIDIVDNSNIPVSSPSVSMNPVIASTECQTSAGTLGTPTQKIRIQNFTTSPQWTFTIVGSSGTTELWSAGTPKYDYNDSTGSPQGCAAGIDEDLLAGQLTIDPTVATITPSAGCSATGLNISSQTSFSGPANNTITVISSSNTAQTGCYWDITGIGLSQTIPAGQSPGSYNINMLMSITAN